MAEIELPAMSIGYLPNGVKLIKFINKTIWNNFKFTNIKDRITFNRSSDGIHKNLSYSFFLTRSSGDHPLKIKFNIYRILGEIISSYNNSFLPENRDISDLIDTGTMKWQSEKIDFSDILARSALLAAAIFKKIRPLKQERPFRAGFYSTLSDNTYLIIKGEAKPDISIWGSFRIRNFIREVKIRIKDHVLISDNMVISVYNESGKGGWLETSLILKE